MRKLFQILFVTVIVTLLATSCSFPWKDQTSDSDVLSGNDVTILDVDVNVDSRNFSTTEFRTCDSAVQVEGDDSCGITIEATP